ncbi:MAG TPA: class I SAM-dependent methyltransferase [Ardenticatenaceae bacterium]
MRARRTLLQRFFGLLYTRLAWGYDVVAWLASAGQWYRWVEASLPFVEVGPVLEVGCGRGRLLRPLAERGHQVTGVDYSGEMARYAAQESGQPIVQGDGRALPFGDGQFATLVTTFPAPYVLEGETQREFARVVRPGGLWLWVDAPALAPTASTALARLLARAAQGRASDDEVTHYLSRDRSDGLWSVSVERVSVGPTTVAVRVARRTVDDGR